MAYNKKQFEQQKANALKLWNEKPGLSIKDVQNLTGLSHGSATRLKKKLDQDKRTGIPSPSHSTQATPVPTPDQGKTGTVDFEDSPVPIEDKPKSIVDKGLDKIKAMLGIEDKPGDTPALPAVALTPKQKAFVESVSPIISLGFVALGAAIWYRIGPEYKLLAPKEDVARKICEPLVRIYARHTSFVPEMNPDWTDVGASLFALVGYIYASLEVYERIKEEKEAYDYEHGAGAYRARVTGTNVVGAENGTNHKNGRYADVQGAGEANARQPGSNGGYVQPVNGGNLTPKEQKQFEALSRLSQQDFESRLRRSGQFR